MKTLKITKGNLTLEYTGLTTEEIKDVVRDILHPEPDKPIVEQEPIVKPVVEQEIKLNNDTKEPAPIFIENEVINLPSKEEVMNYITSKPDFEHNYADLQVKYLGKRIGSRGEDAKLYSAFDGVVRRAKEQILKDHKDTTWKVTGHLDFGFKKRIAVFKLVKSEEVKPTTQTGQVLEVKGGAQPLEKWA